MLIKDHFFSDRGAERLTRSENVDQVVEKYPGHHKRHKVCRHSRLEELVEIAEVRFCFEAESHSQEARD